MSWFGRRKGDKDPPAALPPADGKIGQVSNVIDFPQKQKIPPESRLAVHQLLDKILDHLEEDEYIVIEVCGSSDDDVA